MGQDKVKMTKEDLTGKAEQSEAAEASQASPEQTEWERDNKGAKDVTPEAKKRKDELKEAPESLKNSR
ncbi:hypothetical protein [Chitinophaga sp. CF418]|uniref:hypothetical protein n=1 Tax=Chitinophaga sp. CF418 TaxID=1855287 RepID=UPI000913B8F2|nr:hypothetical protein [Chitinophaga sp. CF418]SHN29908.1 hypothetical protein SAMN05216311_108257 [Chitinophaga sp. CF418]